MNRCPNKLLILLAALLFSLLTPAYAEKADREKPIHIESDRVNVDDARRVSTFEGNVELTQGTLHFIAEKLVVTEDANGNKFCVATGRLASFKQKRDDINEYVEGYGERIEYNTSNETVNFYGQARVKRDKDEVRGNHITYSTLTEIFHVSGSSSSGRVSAVIQPKNKEGQAIPSSRDEHKNEITPAGKFTK